MNPGFRPGLRFRRVGRGSESTGTRGTSVSAHDPCGEGQGAGDGGEGASGPRAVGRARGALGLGRLGREGPGRGPLRGGAVHARAPDGRRDRDVPLGIRVTGPGRQSPGLTPTVASPFLRLRLRRKKGAPPLPGPSLLAPGVATSGEGGGRGARPREPSTCPARRTRASSAPGPNSARTRPRPRSTADRSTGGPRVAHWTPSRPAGVLSRSSHRPLSALVPNPRRPITPYALGRPPHLPAEPLAANSGSLRGPDLQPGIGTAPTPRPGSSG